MNFIKSKPLIIAKLKLSYMLVFLYMFLQTANKFDVNKKNYEYFPASSKGNAV